MAKTARRSWWATACSSARSRRLRRVYGLLETQFRNGFEKAAHQKGITGENLFVGLERRLDNVIYRMGFGTSRAQARQIVRHGHIQVNGRKVNIPSFQVKLGDEVAVRESSKENPTILGGSRRHGARSVARLDGCRSRKPARQNHRPAQARRTGADSD